MIKVEGVKTLHVIGTRGYPSYYGGFETALRKTLPHIANSGWSVRVYGRKSSDRKSPEADPRIEVVTTFGVENKSLSTLSFGLTATIHSALSRPNAVLVMNVANGFWLPIYKLFRVPTLVNVDGIEWERDKWGKLAKLVFRAAAFMTARFADELVSDSKEIQRIWSERYKRQSHFIPYGGELFDQLDAPLELNSGEYVLMVARFVPENTIVEFFAAAEALAKDFPVVIVGSSGYGGPLDEEAERLQTCYSSVSWLGHVRNDQLLHNLWANAGAYFHGHSVGGTNPALVQAMACGAPIVARDTVYNREVLNDSAVFVQPNGLEIAKACSNLLQDVSRRRELGSAAKARASSHYSWRSVSESYEQALQGLANRVHESET